MLRPTGYSDLSLKAAFLGAASLAINSVIYFISGDAAIPVGYTLVFLSAIALGMSPGLISVAVGVVPYTLIAGNQMDAPRLFVLCLAIGYISKKFPRFPIVVVPLVFWMFLFGPLLLHLHAQFPNPDIWWSKPQNALFLLDTGCILVAALLLLNNDIWCKLTGIPRHVPIQSYLVHLLEIISFFSVALAFIAINLAESNFWWCYAATATPLLFSIWMGKTLAGFLESNFQYLYKSTLPSKETTSTFSGLAAEHWRRQVRTKKHILSRGIWKRPETDRAALPSILQDDSSDEDNPPKRGVCVLSRDGTIGFINKTFLNLLEISVDGVIGKRIDCIGIPKEIYIPLLNLMEEALSTNNTKMVELRIKGSKKTKFIELTARVSSAYETEDEKESDSPGSAIITAEDITAKRSIEEETLRSQKLESLGLLVNGLAHEFNNTLTTILARASLAERDDISLQEAHAALSEIHAYAKSAGTTVRSILEFAGNASSGAKPVSLPDLISEKLTLLQKLVGENYEIKYSHSDAAIEVSCNDNMIMQALTNLVLHARNSYPDGGEIIISLDTEEITPEVSTLHLGVAPGKFARLRVKDKGIGMSRESIAKAFDPTKATEDDTHLGLSIVYAIVKTHDGFLTAESHPGKGTTVSLYLPLIEESETYDEPQEKQIKEEPHTSTQPYSTKESQCNKKEDSDKKQFSILVVEDEPNVRELTSCMLEELGYDVVSCDNGRDAISLASQKKFDLVLLDFVIPKINGNELINALKDINSNTKTLIMTGYGSTIEADDSLIIHKPFDMDSLANAISKALH